MKLLSWVVLMLLLVQGWAMGQLKSQAEKPPVNVLGGILSPSNGGLFGLFSPDRFYMSHSYGLTYYTGGGQSGSMGIYTNTMNFKLSDPLFLRVNMGLQHQPFGGPKIYENQGAQFLHGAELIYQPNRNLQMTVGYSNNPFYSGYGFYPNPFYRSPGLYDGFGSGR